jgi:hypothetical protein
MYADAVTGRGACWARPGADGCMRGGRRGSVETKGTVRTDQRAPGRRSPSLDVAQAAPGSGPCVAHRVSASLVLRPAAVHAHGRHIAGGRQETGRVRSDQTSSARAEDRQIRRGGSTAHIVPDMTRVM